MSVQNLTPGVKPIQWNIQSDQVAPKWDWFWERQRVVYPLMSPGFTFQDAGRKRRSMLRQGSADVFTVSRLGRCHEYDGTNGEYHRTAFNGLDTEVGNSYSAIAVYEMDTVDEGAIIAAFDNGTASNRWWGLRPLSSNNDLSWFNYNTSNVIDQAVIDDAAQYDGTPRLAIGMSDLDEQELHLWSAAVPGGALTKVANTSPVNPLRKTTPPFLMLANYDHVNEDNCIPMRLYWAAFLDGLVSDAEARMLIQDPFGPFRPDFRVIGRTPDVGGGLIIPTAMYNYRRLRVA